MRLAETLIEAGLSYEALSYCDAGMQHGRKANPRIQEELLGFTAEVQGCLGNRRESEHLVNRAAELAVGAVRLPTSGGINFCETAAAEYQAGEALRRGDTSTALGHIARARKL